MEARLSQYRGTAHQRRNPAATARPRRLAPFVGSSQAPFDLASPRRDTSSPSDSEEEEEILAHISIETPSFPTRVAQHVMTLISKHEDAWQQAESTLLEGSENKQAYDRFGSKFFVASTRGRKRGASDEFETTSSKRKATNNTINYGKTQWAFLLDLQELAEPKEIIAFTIEQGVEPLAFLEGSIEMETISQMQQRPLEQQSVKYIINALVTCNMLLTKRSELDRVRQCFISLALYDMLAILKPGASTRQLNDEMLETMLRFVDEGRDCDLEEVKNAIKRGEKLHRICSELGEGAIMVLAAHMSDYSLLKCTPLCMRGEEKSPHFRAAMHHMIDLGVQDLVTPGIRVLAEGLRAFLINNFRDAYDRELKALQAQSRRRDEEGRGKTRGLLQWFGRG